MTDREKLIELMYSCPDCRMLSVGEIQRISDYILSHGVTMQEKGEWIDRSPYIGHYCSRCGRITGNAILYNGTLISKFCDNCGADMRGENHD